MRTSRTSKSASGEEEKVTLLPDRPDLTKKQTEFLHIYAAAPFLSLKEIAKQACVSMTQVQRWRKQSSTFQEALAREQLRTQQAANLSRKKVMYGMLKAIEMAEDMRQPSTMISGWKEIGRMCGFYEPERREIKLSLDSQQLLEQVRTIPREKLLQLASEQDSIDAEYTLVEG